jgi:hypothetical protein
LDTKSYLQEYPKLVSKIYGSLYSDENQKRDFT